MSDKKTLKYKALITAATFAIIMMLVNGPIADGAAAIILGGAWGTLVGLLWLPYITESIHGFLDRVFKKATYSPAANSDFDWARFQALMDNENVRGVSALEGEYKVAKKRPQLGG